MTRLFEKNKRKRRPADIDITPLIDVMFMLILFLVITATFIQGSIEVDLPVGSPPPLQDNRQVVLTVTRDSEILWGGENVPSGELLPRIEEAIRGNVDILLAGDRDARYGDVAELLDLLRRSGVTSVGLAFEGSR